MTAILRIVNVQVIDSSTIEVTFTESLTRNLVPANVSILSRTANVADSQPQIVTPSGPNLTIICQPLIPFASYSLQFQNTPENPFTSVNGDAKISQDGVSNVFLISGPISPDNPVQQYLTSFYHNNIYDITDTTTVVSQYIQSIAVNFARALYDIRQVKNENYLSFTIIDEQHARGAGPTDRLFEEAVYDVFRVGFSPTNIKVPNAFVFADFPTYPITLQRQLSTEIIKPSSNNNDGSFNIDTLTFNLGKNPVTKVNSIVFTLTTADPVYTYDIPKLGYQLLDSTFDQDFASTYLLLADNQVKINEAILQDPLFSLDKIFHVVVQYEYKGLGINVDPQSVNVHTTRQSIREVLPPIINIFNLQHAPVTDSSNNTPTVGGVTFTDPNSNTGSPHPAFLTEIPFSLSALPAVPGIYSIDYPNGTVYVYGATTLNDGTGPSPPLATYNYRYTYVSEIDYVYDADSLELVGLPFGNLINNSGTVNFKYEQVLVPGVDYIAETHIESLNESVNNNVIALNALRTQNSPITNVFQIYNQTSGEIYTLNRWNDNIVYFNYHSPPRILSEVRENATFASVTNELLTVNNSVTNSHSLTVFVIFLANNNIIAATQDCTASFINTSMMFTSGNVFVSERWYNQEFGAISNYNQLQNPGEYVIDYLNGIVYLAAPLTANFDLGTANYLMDSITPTFPNLVSVNDIYYQISSLTPKNKHFSYVSFGLNSIIPEGLDIADEAFLNGVATAPYQYFQGVVGAFIDTGFVPGVTNAVKYVRSVYEYNDLVNSLHPINFAVSSTSNNFIITVNPIVGQSFENVQFDGTNYFVDLNLNIPYISPGITFTFSVIRASDSQQLWSSSGTIVPGNPLKLILPGVGSPQVGDLVNVNYSFAIVPAERVVVDYNKGDFFVDYTYVADEILVSYEYGDNVLDFSQGNALSTNDQYYVSYKVGALRDSLLKNFGTLVNVPDLATFDLTLPRERYREALQAALSSFIQGPTVAAIKNIGQIISHIEPQVIESASLAWSLGSSVLFPTSVETTGDFQLLPAHFSNGVLIDQPGQTISMPINSNLRLEEGTFETWVLPQWNGLDNDAALTFTITRDGYAINPYRVFIGGSEYHPAISGGSFTLTKNSNVTGSPNTHKDGIFIYYGNDTSGNFQRWFVEVIDGYVASDDHTYQFQIASSGKFYDVKPLGGVKPNNLRTFTGTSKVSMTITPPGDGYGIDEGITFLSDPDHYILDLGAEKNKSRLSIYKDVSGYMNFRVFDKHGTMYSVSADVSAWQVNQVHMVAASWKLNTRNSRDEMHLFIDGFEVPNIIKYGQKLQPYLHEKFRTVDPEEIVGLSSRDIVGSDDLVTIRGTNIVTSSLNFSSFQIFIGDTIFINELGFSTSGYIIEAIDGQTLTLNANMPISLTNGRFSVNETQFVITSEINIVPNITVSTIQPAVGASDLDAIMGSPTFTSTSIDFTQKGIQPGYLLRVDDPAFELTYSIVQVSGHSITITDPAPISLTNATFQVYSTIETELPGVRALDPDYSISQDANFNNILTIYNGVFANDLILIRLLGLNFRDVKKQYYVWSSEIENVLKTQMPPPISLDQANITRIITPNTTIGPNNAALSGGIFYSVDLPTARPSNSQNGRTIQATISGTNVDFSVPVQVTINGTTGMVIVSETISFTNYGTLDFANAYTSLNYVQVDAKPINPNKNVLSIDVREKYPITHSEFSGLAPVIRYSYHIGAGYNLSADGYDNMVTDGYNVFSGLDIGNYLLINSPPSVAGYYVITGLSADRHSVSIQSTITSFPVPLPAFTHGVYTVLNTNAYRSGLQNGYFTLEIGELPGQAYFLSQGFYELDYSTYVSIKFDALNSNLFVGTDMFGHETANAILDQSTIYSIMLTDTRVGEVVAVNQHSITKDFNSLKSPTADSNTLVLIDYDTFPFSNDARFYASTNDDHLHFQSDWTVNDNFGQSLVILDKPVLLPNTGILNTKTQGTIEFWMSPLYDTANDPFSRFYFDAYGAIVEEVTSVNNVSVKVSTPISKVLRVTLAAGDQEIDYFAGGKVEIDTQRAIQEEGRSQGVGMVVVSQPILQVITVKIAGDPTGKDYFNNGEISPDLKTIFLGTPLPIPSLPLIITYQTTNNDDVTLNTQVIRLNRVLPAQNSSVIVTYLPSGLQGDRISVFKDPYGYMNFSINASGTNFVVRAPTRWARNTWHRVKAQYMFNGGVGNDQMRLFLDGYQYTDVLFGEGLLCGKFPMVLGSTSVGDGYSLISSITFKDPINDLFIGSDYAGNSPIFTLLENFRISNISRPIYAPYGEPIDVNYSTNLGIVFPVTSDLFTTYLMNSATQIELIDTFTTLVNRGTGAFEFVVNIFDSFGIVSSNPQVKQILENLINILQPATSTAFINIIP
jgi:hypothetical protein